MSENDQLRAQLAALLDWKEAHAGFDKAVENFPANLRGKKAAGSPHSAWELLEHLRLAQADILDFCRNPKYEELEWPDDYWPANAAPPDERAWDDSIAKFRADREGMKTLATDTSIDLFAKIPHGTGQTYIREVLLVADHNAYHVGELVLLRRELGAWP